MTKAAPALAGSALERTLIWYARRFPLRRGKPRVVNALWRAANGARSPRHLSRLAFDDLLMECDLGQMLQRQYHVFGTYLLEEAHLARRRAAARGAEVASTLARILVSTASPPRPLNL